MVHLRLPLGLCLQKRRCGPGDVQRSSFRRLFPLGEESRVSLEQQLRCLVETLQFHEDDILSLRNQTAVPKPSSDELSSQEPPAFWQFNSAAWNRRVSLPQACGSVGNCLFMSCFICVLRRLNGLGRWCENSGQTLQRGRTDVSSEAFFF